MQGLQCYVVSLNRFFAIFPKWSDFPCLRSWSCTYLYSSRSSRRLRFSWMSLSFSLVRSLLQSSRTLEVIHSALYCSWSLVYPGSEVFFGVLGARDVVGICCGCECLVFMLMGSWGGRCWVGIAWSLVWYHCAWYTGHVSKTSGHCWQSGVRWPSWEQIVHVCSCSCWVVGERGGEYWINCMFKHCLYCCVVGILCWRWWGWWWCVVLNIYIYCCLEHGVVELKCCSCVQLFVLIWGGSPELLGFGVFCPCPG